VTLSSQAEAKGGQAAARLRGSGGKGTAGSRLADTEAQEAREGQAAASERRRRQGEGRQQPG